LRGVLLASREDGLVVSSALHPGVNGAAVAALSASLARRIVSLTRALGQPDPPCFELTGTEGPGNLLLVAVTSGAADRESLQRELVDLATEVG
jgi:hypothetical protein